MTPVCLKVVSCNVRLKLDTALPALQGAGEWRRVVWYVAIDGLAKSNGSTFRAGVLIYYSVDYFDKNVDKNLLDTVKMKA